MERGRRVKSYSNKRPDVATFRQVVAPLRSAVEG